MKLTNEEIKILKEIIQERIRRQEDFSERVGGLEFKDNRPRAFYNKNNLKISFKECRCICHVSLEARRQKGFCWGEISCVHCNKNHKGPAI